MAKLTEADVIKVRAMKGMRTQREIAAQFGISRQQVGDIIRGKRWAWLLDGEAA
ncbi:helix-turn-helix transcriptional regulator [Mesorhizobium sp.]|uniref:helix-turn-helix domain-containing protein n=1 Tax=Mesorhizobium sp. TaxID=1871066 RepID=UPI000FE4CA5A|nr:helix-turn-helix transcriptional regulator [Mesorhizobium sp.]RWO22837.1 MAG: XRE family transcriptional regulator [Mesorhizobium sp.]